MCRVTIGVSNHLDSNGSNYADRTIDGEVCIICNLAARIEYLKVNSVISTVFGIVRIGRLCILKVIAKTHSHKAVGGVVEY